MPLFKFTETSEIHTVWFVGDGETRDWMAVVYRDNPIAAWTAKYRFRYYNSSDPDDPADRKSAYALAGKGMTDLENIVAAIDTISYLCLLNMGPTAKRWRVPVNGGLRSFRRRWRSSRGRSCAQSGARKDDWMTPSADAVDPHDGITPA